MLISTLDWRSKIMPDEIVTPCPACLLDPLSHCIINLGPNLDGSPVVYLSPPRARDISHTEHAVLHLVAALESGLPVGLPEMGDGKCVFLMDCRGYGVMSALVNPAIGLRYAQLLANHYPERLRVACIFEVNSKNRVCFLLLYCGKTSVFSSATGSSRCFLWHLVRFLTR